MTRPVAPVPRIAVLSEVVRNQIAAGEVVERPASIVKELVENSLDAGARRIVVDLEEGGAQLVRVSDDGAGLLPEDLALAFEAHATSKLETPDDLDHIASLGFRGEALASMGSVARCHLFARVADSEVGAEIRVEGGRAQAVREAGGAVGAIVSVRDLFYNTPARRRFLKRPATELGHCLDIVQRLAMAHVGVGFVVNHGGKRVFDVELEMDLLARIRRTYGAELADELVPLESFDGDTRLAGYVAPPRFSRRDTQRQLWFLNGRSLRDKVLTRALREGYRGFLVEGRQPVAVLALSVDPSKVDVNVHPAKSEVRFHDQKRLFGFLVGSLREAVRRTDMATPGMSLVETAMRREERADLGQALLPNPGALPRRTNAAGEPIEVREVEGRAYEIPLPSHGATSLASGAPQHAGAAGQSAADPGSWAPQDDLRGPFLQIDKTYLVRALPDGFEIIDQHALHERLTFETLKREVREGKVEVQRLLVPELVELSRAEVSGLSGRTEELARVGIELAVFGPTTVAVHGLPARLRRPDVPGLVGDLVELLARGGRTPGADEVQEEVLHSAACRSSIMAGDALSEGEIRALLERARAEETDQTCPHARPTRVRFTLADLEKAFHRR